jgi:hypothetical protein
MSPRLQKCPLIQLALKSLQKLAIEMKTKNQTETKEDQSLITNSLSGNKVYICSYHPDRFKSVKIETAQKNVF